MYRTVVVKRVQLEHVPTTTAKRTRCNQRTGIQHLQTLPIVHEQQKKWRIGGASPEVVIFFHELIFQTVFYLTGSFCTEILSRCKKNIFSNSVKKLVSHYFQNTFTIKQNKEDDN